MYYKPMAIISKAVDVVWVLSSLTFAVVAPLFDSQVVLPRALYPTPLVRVHRWFVTEFDHYLVADPPPFFRGLVWLALAFLWPVCIANIYAVITRRHRWIANTSLMAGVFFLTYLSAMLGEMLGSGRATPKLVRFYVPFVLLAVILVLRGLCSCSELPDTAGSVASSSSAQKKRL
ncbi:hypothetical protein PR202_ga12196 [Eleusine coracana subsp. coracana]|uniref:EXPERA domain-containing protein n=1 Tax=Eleusine coracana subsp. coracana TaxID=191504 RepID=A0AAV5CBM4_ELECO|nr:hypothetical protein PR202_ga12196 [Eleusine coracana subsp. coracana]